MKKTLAILLSLALIVCMIPSVTFGAAITGTVTIGTENYTVSFNQSTFDYNAKKQVPNVTLKKNGTTVSNISYTYKMGSTTKENPTEAGLYDVYAPIGENGAEVKMGDFSINSISLANANIKLEEKPEVVVNSAVLSAIRTAASNDKDSVLKTYFQLKYGTTVVSTENYKLSCKPLEENSKVVYVTVSYIPNGSFTDSSKQDIPFREITSLTSFSVEGTGSDFMYTGKKQDPELTVKASADSQALEKGKDYTVTCTSETAVGSTVTVTVKGIGSYVGEIQKSFTIEKFDLSEAVIEPARILVPKDSTNIDFTVKCGGTTLVRGRDYTVGTLSTSTAGDQTVTITGQGNNYTGTKNISYTVVDSTSKDIAMSTLSMSNVTYNGTAQAPAATLKIGTSTVNSSYYTVKYKLHGDGTFSTTKPTNVGTYDVSIELTTTGTSAGYSITGGTPKVFESAFEIKPLDISSSYVAATFGGSVSKPVIVRYNSKELTRYVDYDVDDYSASKTSYTVTGKGNFTGTRTVYAEIRNMSSCSASFSDGKSSGLYGSTYYPDVNVYYGSTRLVKNSDYTVTYKNSSNQTVYYCRDIGTYSVIITGTGSYTGTKTLYFTVEGNDISGYTVTLKNPTVTATDYSQYPVIESVKKSYYTLSSADYTVSYLDAAGKTVISPKEPGTYRVVLTGKNAYTGSTYAYFTITALTQTVTVEKESYKAYYNYSDPFMIDAVGSASSTLTYTSSNPAVASVSSAGIVTVNKVGRAVITVTAPATGKYAAASKEVVVKVYPKKAVISRAPWTDGKKKQAKVRWYYQPGATYYQVRYTRDKDFDPDTYLTKKVTAYKNNYTTQTTTIKNLRSGYRYYFKVRAVYKDEATGVVYYGNWSTARSVVVK